MILISLIHDEACAAESRPVFRVQILSSCPIPWTALPALASPDGVTRQWSPSADPPPGGGAVRKNEQGHLPRCFAGQQSGCERGEPERPAQPSATSLVCDSCRPDPPCSALSQEKQAMYSETFLLQLKNLCFSPFIQRLLVSSSRTPS